MTPWYLFSHTVGGNRDELVDVPRQTLAKAIELLQIR